ncbi:MAG: hypothetical protein U9Q84_01535, partial [Thermodesulfobacteriota bacterium]|nr:hypothetical protein [Thermodesulfobacteriota bacterium]
LGKGVYKIRLGSSDLSKGKRSGYRIISHVTDEIEKVRLLTIYSSFAPFDTGLRHIITSFTSIL